MNGYERENLLNMSSPLILKQRSTCSNSVDRIPAVVLGGNATGLGIIRELGRHGVPVICLDSDLKTVGRYSRYTQFSVCPDFEKAPDAALSVLIELGKRFDRPVLFPSNDMSVLFCSKNENILKSVFRPTCQTPKLAGELTDKQTFYEVASKHGLKVPPSFFPADPSQLESLREKISFPCLIKPAVSHLFIGSNRLKAELVDDWDQLTVRCLRLMRNCRIIIQSVVTGRDDGQYSLAAYLDDNGEVRGLFHTHKIRTYPTGFGVGSYVESCHRPELNDIGLGFLRTVGYRGMAEIEFRYAEGDPEPYVIEINTRSWAQNVLAESCGVPFAFLAYCHASGHPCTLPTHYPDSVGYLSPERDLISAIEYMQKGLLRFADYLKSLTKVRSTDIFAFDDLSPFFAYLRNGRIIRPERRVASMMRRCFGGSA